MPSPTVDRILGDVLMHTHDAADITGLTSHDPVTLASPNHGLSLTSQVIGMGTPSSITTSSTNSVTTTTHTHAITGFATGSGSASGTNTGDVTLGTNTATALSLFGQQLSLADKFLQLAGDTATGTMQFGTSPATYIYTTGVVDAGLNITLATKPALSREGNSGVVSNLWVGVAKPSGLTTGYENLVFAGDSGATTSGKGITSGFGNTLIGRGAGYNVTTGFSNLLIGVQSGASITGGGGNIGIGPNVFYGANPNNCLAIGGFAAYNLQTGYGTYIGDRASYSQQYGYHNCSIGDYTLYSNTGGSDNTALGWYSGYNIDGNRNVTLGAFAGNNSAFASLDDQLIIANSTTATPLIYGNFATPSLTFQGTVIFNEGGVSTYDVRMESDTEANFFLLDANGNTDGTLYIGGNSITTAHSSRKGGLFFPVQAPTASAPTYAKGALYFDTTLNKLMVGGATAWETVTSS